MNTFVKKLDVVGRIFGASLVAMALLVAGSACNKKAANDVIRIGEVGSMTGGEASFGVSTHNGIQLAIDQANAKGGVLGKQLMDIALDNRGIEEETGTATTRLITRDKVVAILGEVASGRSLIMAPIAQQYKIPMISPSSTNPDVTKVGDYIFRVCFIDPFQGTVMAKFASDELKAKKVAVLRDVRAAYSVGLANFFIETFKKNGGEIVIDQSYSSDDKDFNAQLTAIRAKNPDAIFVPGYYQAVGLIARQARQLGIKAPLLGGDGWDAPSLTQVAGSSLDGSYFSNHYSPENQDPRIQEFIKEYKAKFGAIPDGMAASGYDAARVLIDAIQRAGSTEPAKIRDAIAATKDFPGVTGTISIDSNRNAVKPAVVLRIENGQFKYKTTINP